MHLEEENCFSITASLSIFPDLPITELQRDENGRTTLHFKIIVYSIQIEYRFFRRHQIIYLICRSCIHMHYCHLHAFDLYRDYNLNITQWLHNVFSRYIFVISFKCSSIRFGGYFRGGGSLLYACFRTRTYVFLRKPR